MKVKHRLARPPALAKIVDYVCTSYRLSKAALLALGMARLTAEARALVAWLALKTKASFLAALAQYSDRDLSTVSHALSRLEERPRKFEDFANTLSRHIQLAKPIVPLWFQSR